jgi:hypothetical protein
MGRHGAVRHRALLRAPRRGPKLEALTRERKLAVLVAVANDGTAAIKGLIIDGKLQYEEPLL